jgi:hypothetical protein
MPARCYPGFEPGQTLTAQDLEVLRTFLDDQGRMTRQMIGFGTVCGLDGVVDGTEVVIGRGLAIDQDGEGALLDAEVELTTTTPDEDTFDFIDAEPGGFTPVLVIDDVEQPAPACDERGCERHATLWCRVPRVVLVPGRLVVDAHGFAAEPLLALDPVRVSPTGAVHGGFVELRNAIVKRWEQEKIALSADARAVLSSRLVIATSDLIGIKTYKAAFINQVLFATLDLLRCRSLHRAACLRTEGDRGLALGWVDVSGSSSTWDGRYRHHFQPPVGLVSALLGGRSDDPCDLARARLETLLLSFQVPHVPKPEEPPTRTPPTFRPCKPTKKGKYWLGSDCIVWTVPPKDIPEWRKPFEIIPEVELYRPQDWWTDPRPDEWWLYGQPPLDLTEAGTVDLLPALGRDAELAGGILGDVIAEHGLTPDVRVLDRTQAGKLTGFSYGVTVSMGDTLVLVADDVGKVVATGRVANAHTLRGAEAGLADAVGKASGALDRATQAVGLASTFDERITGTEAKVSDLDGFRDEMAIWQAGVSPKIDGLDGTIDLAVQQALPGVQAQLQTYIVQTIGLERDRWTVEADRLSQRVDELYRINVTEGPGAGQVVTNRQLVTVLDTMRRSIETGVTGDAAAAVREELARSDDAMLGLERAVVSGGPIVEVAPTELTTVLDSLVAAAGKAGVPGDQVRQLERDVGVLRGQLR